MSEPMHDVNRRQLQERVLEQEDVIRRLWDRYTQDVGREPDVGEISCLGDGRPVPARMEVVREVLDKDQNFEDAVKQFKFRWTHSFSEASTQRVATKLMHGRKPAVVSRKTGDIVLHGFWGKGVCMPAFDQLMQKVRSLQHGSFRRVDLSDNGLNGNFVPSIVEILQRGAHQLNLSHNILEAPAMQQLCIALPQVAQFLDLLDLRCNPCSSHPLFISCLARILPEMKFLVVLAVTVRCDGGTLGRDVGSLVTSTPRGTHNDTVQKKRRPRQDARPATAEGRRAHGTTMTGSVRRGRPSALQIRGSSAAQRQRSAASVALSGQQSATGLEDSRPRSTSLSRLAAQNVDGHDTTTLGSDACVALFRSIAQCSQLQTLDLQSSLLSHAAIQRLAHFIRGDQLAVLGLADCFLAKDAAILLDSIGTCRKLAFLNMRLNALGPVGLKVCMALDSSVSLTEVDLSSNDLGDEFGENFAKVLSSNEVLWRVNLVRNPLGERSGDALLDVLRRRNTTLTSIGDYDNNFHDFGVLQRFEIRRLLNANLRALDASDVVEETADLGVADFDFKIIDDRTPPFEPLGVLL